MGAQALSSFDDAGQMAHIVWNTPHSRHLHDTASGFSHKTGGQKLDAASMLTIAEMAHSRATVGPVDAFGYNS
jgi:hypothetical protein